MSSRDTLSWTVRVSARDRTSVAVYARKSRFEVGPPLAIDVEDERVSALEYLLGALGADLVAGMKTQCHKRRLEVDSVEAVVHGQLDNALVHLGVVGEEGHPGLSHATVKVYVETLEEEADIRVVWDQVVARSPLYQTLSAAAQLDIELAVVM